MIGPSWWAQAGAPEASRGAQRGSAEPLWRALAVFRFASLGYAALRLAVIDRADYSRPDWAWVVIAVMTAWTVGTTIAYARPERRTRVLLGVDFAVTAGLLLSTAALQYPQSPRHGVAPVTATWLAGPVLAWAVRYGRRAGAIAALIMSGCELALVRAAAFGAGAQRPGAAAAGRRHRRPRVPARRRAGGGASARHRGRGGQAGSANAWPATSTTRCSRSWRWCSGGVPRRAAPRPNSAGWRASRKPRSVPWLAAGPRGTAAGAAPGAPGNVDLRSVMLPAQTDRVTVSVPAQPVLVSNAAADELASAMHAALDNVRRHCGERARAWVLVEDEPGLVTVTIRDDGPGIADGRLAEAAAAGRLGVSHSIHGRLRDLGGSASISSAPGEGTEVELRLPRGAGVPVARSPERA